MAPAAQSVKSENVADLVPTNWLDPLLTGPRAVLGQPPYTCADVERLLRAVKQRLASARPPAPAPDLRLACEWGFRSAEKGRNLEHTLALFEDVLANRAALPSAPATAPEPQEQ